MAAGGVGGAGGATSSGTGGAAGLAGAAGEASAGAGGAAGSGTAGVAGSGAAGSGAAGSGVAGSGTDGGAADAPAGTRNLSTDRTLFFGTSRCAQANVQLCEDFESGTLDTATWTTLGAKPVIDGAQAARGGKALHLMITGNGQTAIREKKTFPEANDTYYGRVFVYFASLPTPATGFDYAHWTMIAASGTQVMGEIRVSGQMSNGKSLWGVGTDNRVDANGTGDWTNSDGDPNGKPVAVPTGQWMCIEWMHKGDTSETQFWWDGTLHPSLSTTSTMHGGNNNPFLLPKFTQVWIGWQEYQDSTERFEMWIDEIAIDSQRIGCAL